jgi:hypothetical protein
VSIGCMNEWPARLIEDLGDVGSTYHSGRSGCRRRLGDRSIDDGGLALLLVVGW